MCSSRSTDSTPGAGARRGAPSPGPGRVELSGEKSRGRPQDLIRPAQLPHLAPQLGELFLLLGGEQVVPLTGVGLCLWIQPRRAS